MQRLLFAIIAVLAALLLAQEPHVQQADEFFLGWLLRNSQPTSAPVPLIVVELAARSLAGNGDETGAAPPRETSSTVSPLEFALFLQSMLEWNPTVLAMEPILRWRASDRDQEQVFLDQAMRVPKLLLAAELTSTPDPDVFPADIPGFVQVKGRRGDLPTFTGISRQPDEDLRLISTLGFINLPDETTNEIHVPLLFQYRGEIIPAYAFQAFLAWARIPLREVKISLGEYIEMPRGWRIPIGTDGSIIVNPNAASLARHLSLSEVLLLAQQKPRDPLLATIPGALVLARTPRNPLAPPDIFSAAIATMQSNRYVRRVSVIFDCVVLLLIVLLACLGARARRLDVVLGILAFTAAYCLASLTLLSRYELWLPGVVPLTTAWLLTAIALAWPRPVDETTPAHTISS
ncbi:MAG: hypothetical protein ABI839_04770 [Verrucomicrobiota bacterium]